MTVGGASHPGGRDSLRIGLLWRQDPEEPRSRFRFDPVVDALAVRGVEVVPVPFSDDASAEVRDRLTSLDGVLVWVDPIMNGVDRSILDRLLRDVAARGVYVSAHPDVILAMGTKEVLYRTREMDWGTDTRLYADLDEMAIELPRAIASGPRVLKQYRGSGGNGVWRVESHPVSSEGRPPRVLVLHGARESVVEEMSFEVFIRRCEPYFANGAPMVDQALQPRLAEGMVRCYMGRDRVAGFGHQMVTALLAPSEVGAEPSSPPTRLYYRPDKEDFQGIRSRMESAWLPALIEILGIDCRQLPAIWDADFLYGPPSDGEDTFVLCEINVSSVYPMPDEAAGPLAEAAVQGSIEARGSRRAT